MPDLAAALPLPPVAFLLIVPAAAHRPEREGPFPLQSAWGPSAPAKMNFEVEPTQGRPGARSRRSK
jgi:hypothetical protein